MVSARVLPPPEIQSIGGGVSRAPEGHPGRTDQSVDLRDRTSVYAGCFLVYTCM